MTHSSLSEALQQELAKISRMQQNLSVPPDPLEIDLLKRYVRRYYALLLDYASGEGDVLLSEDLAIRSKPARPVVPTPASSWSPSSPPPSAPAPTVPANKPTAPAASSAAPPAPQASSSEPMLDQKQKQEWETTPEPAQPSASQDLMSSRQEPAAPLASDADPLPKQEDPSEAPRASNREPSDNTSSNRPQPADAAKAAPTPAPGAGLHTEEEEEPAYAAARHSADQAPSLNERFAQSAERTAHPRLSDQPLGKRIDINERSLFVRELFDGNSEAFQQAVRSIDGFADRAMAEQFLQQDLAQRYNWPEESRVVAHFRDLVEQGFA